MIIFKNEVFLQLGSSRPSVGTSKTDRYFSLIIKDDLQYQHLFKYIYDKVVKYGRNRTLI